MNLKEKLIEAHKKIAELQKENAQLHEKLRAFQQTSINKHTPPHEKVVFYQSYFRGREDVFARMWKRSDGSVGYAPVKQEGELQKLTNKDIFQHLAGKQTIGLYPLLENGNCYFLAVDFDKKNWIKDVKEFVGICDKHNIPTLIERSRSGAGAHIWIFFEEPVPAKWARQLGEKLFQDLKLNSKELESFDRFFPSQDSLKAGGLGNLIALPLQKEPREKGNSTFVNEAMVPYEDPWNKLFNTRKITKEELQDILSHHVSISLAEKVGAPKQLKIKVSSMVYLPRSEIPMTWIEELKRMASVSNPAYFKAKAKRQSTKLTASYVECFEMTEEYLMLPNGLLPTIENYFKERKVAVQIKDERSLGNKESFAFLGKLRIDQEEAVRLFTKEKMGILAAGTGFGKTVVAASLIAERKVNTLVIVDRTMLIDQWREALAAFLQIPIEEIGQIGGGKAKITNKIDLAMVQSLKKYKDTELLCKYGQVIVDECHHISAISFEDVMRYISASYVHGLTATPVRKDGLHPIIRMYCGEILYKTNAKRLSDQQDFHHKLFVRETQVEVNSSNISEIYDKLSNNSGRNTLIFDDIMQALEEKRTPLILTERIDHLNTIQEMLEGFAKNIMILKGNMGKKERNKVIERIKSISDHEEMVIISTGKFVGEGFDHARLDSLFLTLPISWKGTLQQYVGRLHRQYEGKHEVRVYDYLDGKTPFLKKMFDNRMKGYKALGYTSDKNNAETTKQMSLFD